MKQFLMRGVIILAIIRDVFISMCSATRCCQLLHEINSGDMRNLPSGNSLLFGRWGKPQSLNRGLAVMSKMGHCI